MHRHTREILAIAFPAIITNITTPILGLVDIAITGHIGDAVYLAAISLGGTVFNMLYWLFGFLRMGSSGLTAQAFGAGDKKAESLVFYRAIWSSIIISAALIAISPFAGKSVIDFMDADDNAGVLALRYVSICIWGAPAVLLSYSLSGWFLGLQNSRIPMWMAITTNVINIIVSLVLVVFAGMKIEGVAIGTTVAQWTGTLFGLWQAFFRYRPRRITLREFADLNGARRFFRINSDIFLRTLCLIAVTVWFTHAGASAGIDTLAANAVLLQFFMLFSYFMDGFAFSGEALCGKYYGKTDYKSLRHIISSLHRTGFMAAVVFSLTYYLGGRQFIALLTSDIIVIKTAIDYLPWVVAIPLCGYMSFLWDGIMIGLTATRRMLVSMAVSVAVFFCIYFAFRRHMGNNALWLAFDSYLLMRGLLQRMLKTRF